MLFPWSKHPSRRRFPSVRLAVEILEDRMVLSWAGLPPGQIAPPVSAPTVTANSLGDVSGAGSIASNEVDYYKFTPTLNGRYQFAATAAGGSGIDTVAAIFTAGGSLLTYNDDISSSNFNSRFSCNLAAGTLYYIGITNWSGTGGGAYAWSAQRDDIYEDNDTLGTATNLGVVLTNKTVSGLAMHDGADCFKFQLGAAAGSTAAVQISFDDTQGDLNLSLFSSTGILLDQSAGSGDLELISLGGRAAGTYFVRVVGAEGAFNPNYVLQVNAAGSVTQWLASNIYDAGLRDLVLARFADLSLNRTDAIALFRQASAAGGVTGNELHDLRFIVTNAATLGLPAYVQNLASKVVNTNRANNWYQGVALGNLAAGNPGIKLDKLVNKWFLGLDRPRTTYGYASAQGALFVSGASYTDIRQGMVGDCYFLAALGAVALRKPATLPGMFTDNGDGTFTVRFYNNGRADYVTVDRALPVSGFGDFVYANMGGSANNAGNELWVALAEKAFTQLAESGWSRGAVPNAYSSIDGGWPGVALSQITGRNAAMYSAPNYNSMSQAFNAGAMMVLASKNKAALMDANGVVSNHAYTVIGFNGSTQKFTVFNPWGLNNGQAPAILTLSWAQVVASFDGFDQLTARGTGNGVAGSAAFSITVAVLDDSGPRSLEQAAANPTGLDSAGNPALEMTDALSPEDAVEALVVARMTSGNAADTPLIWQALEAGILAILDRGQAG